MKFAFVTCVQLGKSVIEKICDLGGKFEFLVTLKDERGVNKSGRIYLDDIAKKYNVPLYKVDNVNDVMILEAIKKYDIDWLFIIGWSQIAKKELLNTPHKGCIGMHPTLLPVGRGRASIPWAIIKGLTKTGVTMFRLDEGIDTGDILGQVEIEIDKNMTATELYAGVEEAHVKLIEKYWKSILDDTIELKEQDERLATEWPGRRPEDGEIYHSMNVVDAERLIRAVTHPYPGAFYYIGNKKIIVWKAKISHKMESMFSFKCKDGYIVPLVFEEG